MIIILLLAWYTFQLYSDLLGRIFLKDDGGIGNKIQPSIKAAEPAVIQNKVEEVVVKQPVVDGIDESKLKEADEEWEKDLQFIQPKKPDRSPCSASSLCGNTEFNFKILTGAANVIGPSVCFNNKILMRNSVNNVDRGMNIAVVDGIQGELVKTSVFDLYGKDSTELKAFLRSLEDHHVILITTYDDAAMKLDTEAKTMLADLGSVHSKNLSFRDNWILIGGRRVQKPTPFEKVVKNDKEKNKYGDWPEAILLEGCLPRLT